MLPPAADQPFCFPLQNGAHGDTQSNLPPSSGRDAELCPGGKKGCETQSSGGKERPERVYASSELTLAACNSGSSCLMTFSGLYASKPISPEISHPQEMHHPPGRCPSDRSLCWLRGARISSSLWMQEVDPDLPSSGRAGLALLVPGMGSAQLCSQPMLWHCWSSKPTALGREGRLTHT